MWKDRLTSFDGQSITYDAQGNPTNYLGHNLTWEKGRQLKSFDGNTYTYNSEGIRISKTVDGIRHDYVVDGGRILKETWLDNTLIPIYNNDLEVIGIYYNCEPYYFYKNLQGDVIGIANTDGTEVVTYTYDAWGVCTVLKDISGVGLANINPYRYRSYYFDTEIGVYYLRSRCYDPVVGRFVNADDPEIIDSASDYTILSCNKYCYCLNSPANNSDEYGTIAALIVKMIFKFMFGMFGGILGMYLGNVALNVLNGEQNIYDKKDTWGQYAAEGVRSGAFSIFGGSLGLKIIAAIGAAVIKQIIDMIFSKKQFSLRGMLFDIIVGILFVVAIHFGSMVLRMLPKKNRTNKFLEKIMSLIEKIGEHITEKIKGFLSLLFELIKTFVKRFSISFAKKCAPKLLTVFRRIN